VFLQSSGGAGVSFEEAIRADPPAEVLDAIDVEFHSVTRSRFTGAHDPRIRTVLTTFSYQPAAGAPIVTWFRWVDEDGDRFYLRDEFMRRAARGSLM
jgi:hypothetical protein